MTDRTLHLTPNESVVIRSPGTYSASAAPSR
jgi:hypothetical protein